MPVRQRVRLVALLGVYFHRAADRGLQLGIGSVRVAQPFEHFQEGRVDFFRGRVFEMDAGLLEVIGAVEEMGTAAEGFLDAQFPSRRNRGTA